MRRARARAARGRRCCSRDIALMIMPGNELPAYRYSHFANRRASAGGHRRWLARNGVTGLGSPGTNELRAGNYSVCFQWTPDSRDWFRCLWAEGEETPFRSGHSVRPCSWELLRSQSAMMEAAFVSGFHVYGRREGKEILFSPGHSVQLGVI